MPTPTAKPSARAAKAAVTRAITRLRPHVASLTAPWQAHAEAIIAAYDARQPLTPAQRRRLSWCGKRANRAPEGAPESYREQQAEVEALRGACGGLPGRDKAFAGDLLAAHDRGCRLTEKQRYWVRRLAAEAASGAPATATPPTSRPSGR
jgi:hypothetical protein